MIPDAAPFPAARFRRARKSKAIRGLVRENLLSPEDLIWPVFVRDGDGVEEPIASMPGVSRLSVDKVAQAATEAYAMGVPAICIFPYTPLEARTEDCAEAWNPDNIANRAIRAVKAAVPEMAVMTDVALDPYNINGHDGFVVDGEIVNDETVEALVKQALSQAEAGVDIANRRTITTESLTTVRGPIAYLPGGELTATFDFGADWRRIESDDTRSQTAAQLTRRRLSSGANLVIPITSRREGFADALGSFTLNLQAGFEDLSDFGILGDYTASLSWAPFDNLDLSASYIVREVAPSLSDLGNPQVVNLNTPVFDFTTGETVLATVITGGNPDLLAETQRDWKFAANWELPFWDGTRFTVEYIRNRSDDVTSGFPQITSETEAAFPDRIVRDANGTLVQVDRRSVTFAETRADRLQFGLFFRGSIGGNDEERGGSSGRGGGGGNSRPQGGPPPGAGGQGGPPSGGPSDEERAAFMQVRERICADDGLEVLTRLAQAIANGEDLSDTIPGFDAQRFERMLDRVRGDDGQIDPEKLAEFRTRICSIDPAAMRGMGRGPGAGQGDGQGRPDGAPPAGPMGEGFAAFRALACAEDGEAKLRALIARIDAGEDVSDELPGFDPNMAGFIIDRLRNEDGTISSEKIAAMRERFCSAEGGQGGQQGGGPPGGFNPLAGRNFSGFRYFVSLNHTIELENTILIAPGLAPLDQLDGDATGAFGLSRHSSRLEAGIFGSGVGMRLSARYTGTAKLNGTTGSSDLFFDDLATFDLRVFANVGELAGKDEGLLDNLRISLRADNVFDARRRVVDANGDTPINYQPFLIDPIGRYVGIDIRKLF